MSLPYSRHHHTFFFVDVGKCTSRLHSENHGHRTRVNVNGPNRLSDVGIYWRLILEARQFWLHIAGLFALSVLSAPLTLLSPLPLKIVVDSVVGSHELPMWL